MTKFLFGLMGFFICIVMSILVMIHGWGLQPVSWGWIVFGSITGSVIGALFQIAD